VNVDERFHVERGAPWFHLLINIAHLVGCGAEPIHLHLLPAGDKQNT
jgi:diadenosine tetraphosphate (Ap4A) HIT family hydrolase